MSSSNIPRTKCNDLSVVDAGENPGVVFRWAAVSVFVAVTLPEEFKSPN